MTDNGFLIIARVIRQEGFCAAGHRVGDEVVFDGQTVQGRVCIHALYSRPIEIGLCRRFTPGVGLRRHSVAR